MGHHTKMMIFMVWSFGFFAMFAWLLPAIDYMLARWRPIRLDSLPEQFPEAFPKLSVVVAALNEARTVEQAMKTLLSLQYPDMEIIAVDDRSTDSTGEILDRLAQAHKRLRVVHITELPPGWLGKNHALHVGGQQATGECILFTDADVHFKKNALKRAVAYFLTNNLDHLTLFPDIDLEGFWERLSVGFFGALFSMHTRPWRVADSRSGAYVGVGAFNLVRTDSYRRMGGHASLPMDVTDDMKLGKRMKMSGGSSACMPSGPLVRVRWVVGLRGLVEGLTKNMFAGFGFHAPYALAAITAIFLMSMWPFIGLFYGPLATRLMCLTAILLMMATADSASPAMVKLSPVYGLFFPIAGIIMQYIILRSMFYTFRQGGIVWRGTLYPLRELRKGLV